MSEPFIAEIRIFAGNFAPRSWAFCNGQLLPISQNTALFSLVGTIYGGDGRTTLALPNLQGRVPVHPGRGPGLTERRIGESGGAATHTLTAAQIPAHNHTLRGSSENGDQLLPGGNVLAVEENNWTMDYSTNGPDGTTMHTDCIGPQGGTQAHNNLQPYLAINFIIALVGLYPSRS